MARTSTFLRTANALDRWLERFNPFTGLTMRRLVAYFDEADMGQYTNLMWLSRKAERRDAVMRACLVRLGEELRRLDWSIQTPAELPKGVTQKQVDDQQQFLRARYDTIENLKASFPHLALARLRGFAHIEKVYNDEGLVRRFECVPQWHWQRDSIYGEWKLSQAARPNDPNARVIDEAERPHWIILEDEIPWIEIALICALRKNLARRDVDGFCAKYGIPNVFFVAPPGATPDDMKDFNAIAEDLASDGGGALPNGSTVETVTPGNNDGKIFKQVIDDQNAEQVLAATGGLLTMLTAPGSGTLAGSAHQEAWENIVGGVAKTISEALQEQFDKIELALQFPDQPVLAWFELSYPDEDESRGEFVEDATKLKTAGWTVKREIMEQKTGLEFEDEAAEPEKVPGSGFPVPGSKTKNEEPRTTNPAVKNRFQGGPSSARDRAEAVQLAETAIAAIVDVQQEILAPLQPELVRLIELATNEQATLADFEALAAQIEQLIPEAVGADEVSTLATEIEAALGSAAAMGARAAVRKTRKARKP